MKEQLVIGQTYSAKVIGRKGVEEVSILALFNNTAVVSIKGTKENGVVRLEDFIFEETR